ncbi:glycosyltransferase family 2 protein [Lysobacter sp. A286]
MSQADIDASSSDGFGPGGRSRTDGSPKVSVVMPVYNAADTVAQSMRSVLEQTYAGLELVVIDDCSNDGSAEVVEGIARTDPRVAILRLPCNGGVAAARNAGIQAATGDYLAFLDSDDWWHPGKLEVQLVQMRAAGARVSYAGYQRVDEAGKPLSTVRPPATVRYADMLKSNRIGNLTGLYDRSLGDGRFQRVGHEDYVFWLQMVRRAGIAVCAMHPEPLAFYRVRAGSLSADKFKAARWQWHIYREVEKLGWADACRYFLHYGVNALAKRH